MLLELGIWDEFTNPWPARFGVVLDAFSESLEDLAKKQVAAAQELVRQDLTAVEAFAVDDADIADPDDAFSVTRGADDVLHVWVHVADVASVVQPDSGLDLAARKRGASCYLTNGTVTMLPERIQKSLGVGLAATSPALSIGFTLEEDGHIDNVKIVRSTVRVTRKSYAEAAQLLEEGGDVWSAIEDAADRFRDRRQENGALGFQMPQARVALDTSGTVQVGVQDQFPSRDVVMEMMLMAGEAAAQFALDNDIPFLYSTQGPLKDLVLQKTQKKQLLKGGRLPPENPFAIAKEKVNADDNGQPQPRIGPPQTLAQKFEFRKRFDRSRTKTHPDTHTGLGMPMYCQISSPLRRYGDLLLHQQLHAFIDGRPLLSADELVDRMDGVEDQIAAVKKAERFTSQFYTLKWLQSQPDWKGEGTCCALWQPRPGAPKVATVLLKDFAFFTTVACKADVKLDSDIGVQLTRVRLVDMKADMKHDVDVKPLYGTEEAKQFKEAWKARKQVGTRLSTATKRQG